MDRHCAVISKRRGAAGSTQQRPFCCVVHVTLILRIEEGGETMNDKIQKSPWSPPTIRRIEDPTGATVDAIEEVRDVAAD